MRKILAFDIGGTNIKFGILNELGEILEKGKVKTRVESEEVFINSLVEIIEEKKNEIEGVAISMPGFIDAEKGIPTACYAIQCIVNKSITQIIKNRTGLKVTLENDGKCAALAEKFSGNAVYCENFICITVGTGIGGGLFINGKIVRGNSFRGGEFGFMVCEGLEKEDMNTSTMSKKASTIALINKYKKYKNIDEAVHIEGHEVFLEAEKDERVRELLEEWYTSLAIGIMNLSATLNPEKIIIGGGISVRENFIEDIEKALNKIQWWNDVNAKIEVCKHKNDAGLIGAVYNYLNS